MSAGSPPTLWWLLILAAVSEPLSITSGYNVPCTRKPALRCSRATSSNTRMNSSPIRRRLSSGSVTPSSRPRNRSSAFTCTSGTRKCRPNVSSTCSGSPSRSNPVSTNTHVSCSPIALCTSSAATAESTPPGERAEHLGLSDLGSDRGDRAFDHVGRGPVREQAAPVVQEPLHHGGPLRRVRDLGVELHRVQGPFGILHRGDRDRVGPGRDAEPRGCPRDGVAVAHPHLLVGGEVLEQDPRLGHVELGTAVLALPRRLDLAAERLRHQLVPVADPEHRDAELEHAGVQGRRPRLVHRRGAAREHDARGRARGELGGGEVVRHDLRVDVALADPARDQLRVLRPEIDDQDRAPGRGHVASDPSRRAGRSGTSCPRS